MAAEPAIHDYTSTACFHGHHDQCGVKQAERGEDGPPHCKHCEAVCACPVCRHGEATDGDMARDRRIAEGKGDET